MGLFNAVASVLPKEAFTDDGWRKAALVIVLNVGVILMSIASLIWVPDKTLAFDKMGAWWEWIIGLDGGFLAYNIGIKLMGKKSEPVEPTK